MKNCDFLLGDEIVCIPGIRRFSVETVSKYYECRPGDLKPVLKQCPYNERYWTSLERCGPLTEQNTNNFVNLRILRSTAASYSDKPDIMERFTLGKDVSLGELYDAKKNRFLSGTSLWSTNTLKKVAKDNLNHLNSDSYSYKTGKTVEEKLDDMNIQAELKLDFLGKLITYLSLSL